MLNRLFEGLRDLKESDNGKKPRILMDHVRLYRLLEFQEANGGDDHQWRERGRRIRRGLPERNYQMPLNCIS